MLIETLLLNQNLIRTIQYQDIKLEYRFLYELKGLT